MILVFFSSRGRDTPLSTPLAIDSYFSRLEPCLLPIVICRLHAHNSAAESLSAQLLLTAMKQVQTLYVRSTHTVTCNLHYVRVFHAFTLKIRMQQTTLFLSLASNLEHL